MSKTNFSNRKFIRSYFDGISTVVTQYIVWDKLGQFWFQGTKEECEQYLYDENRKKKMISKEILNQNKAEG